MKSKLLFIILLLPAMLFAQGDSNVSNTSFFLKLKSEYNDTNRSISEKFNISALQELQLEYPVKEIRLSGNRSQQNTYVVYLQNEENIEQVIERYEQTGLFEYVEHNKGGIAGGQQFEVFNTTPNDALFSRQWGMKNDGSFSLSPAEAGVDIKMEQAWDIETGDPNILIAVLDSGARINHPELSGRLWTNTAEVMDGTDTDGNGFVDDINGWDFAYNDNDPTDDVGHGTNIIGILASNSDNGTAYSGINWSSKVMNIKMLNDQNAYTDGAWAVDAIYYAVDNGADIINMSWGGGAFAPLQDAIEYAASQGVVLIACMMNFDDNTPYYPAAYPETIAVGSIDPDGDRSSPFYWNPNSGSNYGPHIDVIAPGNYTYNITHSSDTNYNIYWGGTSQAAPHVAGVASLLMSKDPLLTPAEIRTILRDTADDQTGDPSEDISGFDNFYGYGRLNAFAALGNALGIQENDFNTTVSIFPNPIVRGTNLTVRSTSSEISQIEFYDVLGKRIFTSEVFSLSKEIDVSSISSGVYMVRIFSNDIKAPVVKKLVIH